MSELESLRVGQAVRTGQGAACTHTRGHTTLGTRRQTQTQAWARRHRRVHEQHAQRRVGTGKSWTRRHTENRRLQRATTAFSAPLWFLPLAHSDCPAWCQASGLGPGPRLLLPWVLRQGPPGILISERIGQMLFPRREPLCLLSQPPHAVSKTQTGWPTALGTHSPVKGGGNPKD